MDEKSVSKSLFKKLSALRATLTDEEQVMLDQMVSGDYEVRAHVTSRVTVTSKMVPGPGGDFTRLTTSDDDEVVAHRMTPVTTLRVVFDETKNTYVVV